MKKSTRWALIVSLVAATGVAMVLAFLLSIATDNRLFYEKHFQWLFWVNLLVAGLLMLVIGIAATRLLVRVQRGKFGSRLLLKLAAIFALVGVLPGLLIYTVSYQFVSRGIESWFDVKVEGALDAGLALGRGTLDSQVNDLASKTQLAADRLGEGRGEVQALALERLREDLSAQNVAIVNGGGQVLLSADRSAELLGPDRPSPSLLRNARDGRAVAQLEGLDDDTSSAGDTSDSAPLIPRAGQARVRALAYLPSTGIALTPQERYLMVTTRLPTALASNALAVQTAYREYQQRSLAREGLREMYIGTLTLTLILAVFGALLLALTLSNQIARPLLMLADGVRQVAQGDLGVKQVFDSRDELGGLTRSFADMTEQLSEARALVQRSVSQVEGARANLQTILDNLTAGVIVFDRQGRIDTVNPGATRIVRLPLGAYRGRRLAEVEGLEDFAAAVWQRFELHADRLDTGERDHWQEAFELQAGPDRDALTLLVRGAAMPEGARLMVFDDITEVVSAQRIEAWGEVARRLAHEIKNPLTPIQLSAERLEHKLAAKLEGADQAMLVRSVGTIVSQVQAMKTLVNEFRDYARLPAARLNPLDLNVLVSEVLTLYATAQEAGTLIFTPAQNLPLIVGDATQLRQVIHNLVQNALDAVADPSQVQPQQQPCVRVRTEVARTEQGAVRVVRLHVTDNGPGFPDKVLKRAFEPYVTTKSKGTGLGLAVVKKIADEHGARVRLVNLESGPIDAPGGDGTVPGPMLIQGAQVSLSFSKFAPTNAHTAAATPDVDTVH
jgi:nitrogen fixation/metabolism regulation signal transduction histidine kinase